MISIILYLVPSLESKNLEIRWIVGGPSALNLGTNVARQSRKLGGNFNSNCRLRMMNITDPAIPPLLQMYPGSRDKTASLSNSEGQDVSIWAIQNFRGYLSASLKHSIPSGQNLPLWNQPCSNGSRNSGFKESYPSAEGVKNRMLSEAGSPKKFG